MHKLNQKLKELVNLSNLCNFQLFADNTKGNSSRFRETSQCVHFISSSFCCYGCSDVNKTYSKIKFSVRYVVSLCGFFILASQQNL